MATNKPSTAVSLDTSVIYCGDNLERLKTLPDACVDLVYIDPPFNSNRNYEVFWGANKGTVAKTRAQKLAANDHARAAEGERRSFEDRHGSTEAYLIFMRPRCEELQRVLKPSGSFYYHCDWHASHYVKVMLDDIFGESNFANEIVWRRTTAHADTHGFGRVHDMLFRYSNGGRATFNVERRPHSPEYLDKFFHP
jgi:DNA modification methylase